MNVWKFSLLLFFMPVFSVFAESFLTAQSFPKTFEDLSFRAKIDFMKDNYEPFANLSAYDKLNIVYTDKNIAEEIAADELESKEDNEIRSEHWAYCQQKLTDVPEFQTVPIGKPVFDADYKYCSGYGVRNFGTDENPKPDNHYGFDIGCTESHYDRPVFTVADGIVEKVQPNRRGSSAGNYIVINHQNGFKTYYMHLNTMSVNQGQIVSAGCQIGTIGYTGGAKINKSQLANSEYPVMRKGISHLHYEIHYNGSLKSVTDSNGKTIPIINKFPGSKSVDPAYFMGLK